MRTMNPRELAPANEHRQHGLRSSIGFIRCIVRNHAQFGRPELLRRVAVLTSVRGAHKTVALHSGGYRPRVIFGYHFHQLPGATHLAFQPPAYTGGDMTLYTIEL